MASSQERNPDGQGSRDRAYPHPLSATSSAGIVRHSWFFGAVVLTIGVSLWIKPQYFGFRYLIWPTSYLGLLAPLGLDHALRSPGRLRHLALATGFGLALNAAIGMLLLIQRLVFGDPQQYPLLANLNPSALSRAEPQFLEDSRRLRMGWDAVPAGRLYARSYGIAIDPGEPPPLLPCIRGQFAPAPANRIATTADPPGLICF